MADETSTGDTKACPLCGETIKKVAIRCKHCQADLSSYREQAAPQPQPSADFTRGDSGRTPREPISEVEFEQRFLDFAYQTEEILTAISVAHALKVPIAFADQRLESLAAGDQIRREVDDEGNVYFELPHKKKPGALVVHSHNAVLRHPGQGPGGALINQPGGPVDVRLLTPPSSPPPTEAQAVTGLVLNLCIPGVGSLVAGKPGPGITQLAMLIAGLPLCFVLVGFPIVFSAWLWALLTGVQALQEAKGVRQL